MNCFSVQPLQTLGPFLNGTFLTDAQIKLPEETKHLRFSPFLDLIQSYSENEHIYLSDHSALLAGSAINGWLKARQRRFENDDHSLPVTWSPDAIS